MFSPQMRNGILHRTGTLPPRRDLGRLIEEGTFVAGELQEKGSWFLGVGGIYGPRNGEGNIDDDCGGSGDS
jgi:hypothetical protein